MSPVSFQRIGEGLDRSQLLDMARTLTAAGIRVQSVDGDRGLLVRSEDAGRALAALKAGDTAAEPDAED